MGNFTAALEVANTDWHITLCFCKAEKLGRFRTGHEATASCKVIDVKHWKDHDITVLIFDNPPGGLIDRRHNYYKKLGYGYDHEFIPHATVAKDNQVDKFKHYIGKSLMVGGEYARTF